MASPNVSSAAPRVSVPVDPLSPREQAIQQEARRVTRDVLTPRYGRFSLRRSDLTGPSPSSPLSTGLAAPNAARTSLVEPRAERSETWFVPIPLDGDDGAKALLALGITGFLMANDRHTQDWVRDHRSDTTRRIADFAEPFGTKGRLGPIIGGTYVAGVVFKDERMRSAAVRALESALLSQAFTEVVKHSTQRLRPRESHDPYDFAGPGGGRSNTSFFSGHSSGSAAVWSSIAKSYSDQPVIRNLAYLMAVLTPWSRVHDDAHWSSDAFLGAAVGFLSAELVHRWHDGDRRGGGLLITPSMDREGNVMVNFVWVGQRPSHQPSRACREATNQRDKVRACLADAFERTG